MKKTRMLMICLGNICRSLLTEGVMRSKLPADSSEVDSAGTASYHIGDAPDPRSITSGKKHEADISMFRGRRFSITDFGAFDYVFAMNRNNCQCLVRLARNERDLNKISFLSDVLDKMTKAEIPDPYYGNEADFKEIHQLIDAACEKIAYKLITNS